MFGFYRLILVVMMLLGVAACASHAAMDVDIESAAASEAQVVYLTNHGIHTGIVVNTEALSAHVPALDNIFSDKRFIEVGWGDEAFYRADSFYWSDAIPALLWPTGSVLHVVGFSSEPSRYFRSIDLYEIQLSQANLESLMQFVAGSFLLDADQAPTRLGTGIYGNSFFFEAQRSYHALYTCNSWTAEAMASAGFDLTPILNLTADSVVRSLGLDETPP